MHNAHCACINKYCRLRVIYLGNCECQLYTCIYIGPSVWRRHLCTSKPYSASNMFVSRGIPTTFA